MAHRPGRSIVIVNMPLREQIQSAQKEALKDRDAERLSTLRMLWSAIRTEEINQQRELAEAEIVAVVSRQIKQAQDALQDFERGARQDLIQKAQLEIDLLRGYLPAQLSDEALLAVVDKILGSASFTGAPDIGRVMGLVMKEVKGQADGSRVRALVAKKLS